MTPIEQAIDALNKCDIEFSSDGYSESSNKRKCVIDAITALQSMQGEAVGTVYVSDQDPYKHGRNFYWLTNPRNIPDGTQLYTQPQSPAGYVLVPFEPTDAMMDAGSGFAQVEFGGFMSDHAAIVGEIYSAMLSASQGGNNESK